MRWCQRVHGVLESTAPLPAGRYASFRSAQLDWERTATFAVAVVRWHIARSRETALGNAPLPQLRRLRADFDAMRHGTDVRSTYGGARQISFPRV